MVAFIFFWLISPILLVNAAKDRPVRAVNVSPDNLSKTGYWHKEFDKDCGVEMLEAHGANAALTLSFVGSGIVTRFLTCETCSKIEIRIDKLTPVIIDLSERGFKCPDSSPVFTRTDLKHGRHTVSIKRLDETKTVKVMKFEYLTHEQTEDTPSGEGMQLPFSDTDSLSTAGNMAGGVVSSAAKVITKQAMKVAMSYAVMVGTRFAVKALVNLVAGPVYPDGILDGDILGGDVDGADAGDGWFDTGDGGDASGWTGGDAGIFNPDDLGVDPTPTDPDFFDQLGDFLSNIGEMLF